MPWILLILAIVAVVLVILFWGFLQWVAALVLAGIFAFFATMFIHDLYESIKRGEGEGELSTGTNLLLGLVCIGLLVGCYFWVPLASVFGTAIGGIACIKVGTLKPKKAKSS